ncbi:MAG TPA: carboxypeptidase regulatory-like domain-containing protein, partial [Pyrinomonadaceae bacterium]|nr:carboxypeptidase regulatory-like domain-containing protein [Pyrinomonadaceae bacterium]
MKSSAKGRPRRVFTLRGWVCLFLAAAAVLAATASARQQQQSATQGGAAGSRQSGVGPKRQTQRRGAGASKAGAAGASATQSTTTSIRSALQGVEEALAAGQPVLATADFDLIGLAVTAGPATQTVPKNTPTSVLTSMLVPEGSDPSAAAAGVNPNYRVRGELSGPSLNSPVTVEAAVGQPLRLPPLSTAGDHVLQNLRVVDIGVEGQPTVAPVTPDACGIVVIERLLVSEVQVRELTYEQIVQAGINISDDSYQFFNFTLGVSTTSDPQQISIPVAFPGVGVADPRPVVGTPLPIAPGVSVPEIVPDILPVMLNIEGGRDGLDLPPDVPLRIPGVVVFPGRIGLLHQFFEATVIVANGAPAGTPLVVHSLKAKVRLPDAGTPADPADDPLRIAETRDYGRVTELELHDLGPDKKYGTADDVNRFAPGKSGQGSFLVEGMKEGLHTINFDLEGTLEGLPAGPVTVRGEVPGAVLVRDASFGVTFSHPSVVRAGQEYDLALTLYNSGARDIQSAVADLTRAGVSGAELLGDEVRRQFPPVARGESATVRWRLRANVTGAVTASYAKVGADISAGLSLVTGVGDRNVPLSPDSLILPDTVGNLPPTVVEAARAVLGQAWSIATAPDGGLPEGVVKVDKRTVVNRAVQLGIAGLRAGFGEPASVSHATLMRDWLGELEAEPDPGFADVLRDTAAGFDFYDSVGAEAARALSDGSKTPADVLGEFVAAESPRSPFIFALVTQARGARVAGARLADGTGRAVGFGGEPVVRSGDLRTGALLRLLAAAPGGTGGEELGQMLLASRPSSGTWSLELTGEADGVVNVALALPVSGGTYRHLSVEGVQVAPGGRHRLTFGTSGTGAVALEEFRDGAFVQTGTAASTSATLSEPAPRVVGVMQVTPEVLAGGDKYGRLVGLLFSKPMTKGSAETASNYTIGGGALVSNPAGQVGGPVRALGAKLDYGDRFAFLSLDTPVGPFIERTLGVSGLTDRRGASLSPAPSNLPIPMRVSPQGVPPGAYLTGRVLGADGSPVAGAQVVYWTKECDQQGLTPPEPKPLAQRLTDADGRYAFDYVRNGDCGPLLVTVTNPATRSEKRLTTPVAYHGQHMTLDMVFLARGGVRGTISMGGRPLPNAVVQVIPSLDAMGSKVVQADGFGQYAAEDIPVGNVSVLAVGTGVAANASGVAAGTIEGPGRTATVNVSLQNVSGVVRGRVVNPDTGASPAAGALVVAYARIPGFGNEQRGDGLTPVGWVNASRDGNFAFENLPVGDITLEVTDYVTGLVARRQVQLTAETPEVGGVVITLPGFGTVSGRVVDETGGFVPNAVVQGAGRAVQADGVGLYTLPNMPAGTHRITATDPATFMSGSVDVEVRLGQNASGINIPVLRPATITGQVFLQEQGASAAVPAAGVFVTANGYTRVQTDTQGRYTVKNVKPNTNVTLRFVDLGKNYVINMPVVVTPGEVLTRNATFRPGSIHGRVTQPDGVSGSASPLSVFSPMPVLTEGEHWGEITTQRPRTTQSGGDGAYRMDGVNPGTFRVTTSSPFFPTPVSAGGVLPPNGDAEVNFSLVNTLAGKIQGTIYKPGGTTTAGSGVKVALGGGALADVSVTTDAAGRYEFAEVFAEGGYWLTATDPATGETNRVRISVQKNKDVLADITLRGRGALRVTVVDGAGNPVQNAQLSLAGGEYPNAQRYIDLTPAMNGVFEFGNLPEGPYAVSATQNGLAGRASADVATGATVEVTVQLQASGTVRGRAFMPDGVTPIGLADVELRLGGRQVGFSVTSDAEEDRGTFSFLNVPVGDFQLDVFDNRTGRVGRATGRLAAQGEVAEVNVKLLPVGAVAGRVTANGQPVDHALVEIFANGSGIRAERMKATTDAEGRYRFTGVPVGSFQINVTGAPGGQTGSASGFVTGTSEPLADTVVDIALEPSVTVTGVVRSLSDETVNGARVTVLVGNRRYETGTNEQGVYRISYVPLGSVVVRAEAPAGYDRGEATPVAATEPGATLTSDVTLAGIGNVSGTALNNDGTPLSTGTVTYTNDAWSGSRITVAAPVQSNGRYEIKGAPAGPFALKLTVANRVGVGSASGAISAGANLDLSVRLEDAGQVTGRLKSVDGVSPAVGADVTLTLRTPSNQTFRFYGHTDTQGLFLFQNVPLGSATVNVNDATTGGVTRYATQTLASNGQTLDLGTATLDNIPVAVEAVTPADGATGVSPAEPGITVRFSEPVDPSTVHGGTVRLTRGQSTVSVNVSLSDGNRTATVKPSVRLVDTTQYTVVVTTNVADLVGNHLAREVRSAFTTSDSTPPAVTGFAPANGATRVALSTDVVVTFDEKLDPAQDLSQVVVVTADGAPPAAVPGTLTLSADGLSVTFHPTNLLGEGLRHTVRVQGQRDVYGNATAAASSAAFTTLDLMPPVIEPLPIDGKTVRTFRPQITAAYGDNASGVNVASVVLKLDGVNVTPQASVAGTGLSYTPAAPLARGPHTVTLNLSDNQGNAAQQATATFSIDDAGPAISSFQIAGLPASNDMHVTSTLQPSFVVGYADDTGVNASQTKLLFGPYGSTPQPVAATVMQDSLSYTPAAPLAEGRYSVEAVIVNNLGTASTTGRIDFTLDMDAPEITGVTPSSGSQHGGTVVTVTGQRLLTGVTGTGNGLLGEYYDNQDFTGTKLLRTDAMVNFDWGLGSPDPSMGADQFSVRWTGQVQPEFSEAYTFTVLGDDGVRLWVNGQLIVENWTTHAPTEYSGTITLEAGRRYDIRLDYFESAQGAVAKLFWASPSRPKELVPQSRLFVAGTAPAVTVGGNPALVKSAVAGSPDQVVFVTPAGVPGPADIQVSTNRGEGTRPAAFNYEADPRTPFISEPDTVLLWHMDELANGAVRVEDSGPTRAIPGTANATSLAQPGRFAGGRSSANIATASSVTSLYFGNTGFTVEGWFKSGPVGRTYTLFGKEDFHGYYYGPAEYAVRLTPS